MKPELIAALIDALECAIETIESMDGRDNSGNLDPIDLSDLKTILSNAKAQNASPAIDAAGAAQVKRTTFCSEDCTCSREFGEPVCAVAAGASEDAETMAMDEDVPQASVAVIVKDLIECLMLWNGQAFAGLDMDALKGLRDELNSVIAKESGK